MTLLAALAAACSAGFAQVPPGDVALGRDDVTCRRRYVSLTDNAEGKRDTFYLESIRDPGRIPNYYGKVQLALYDAGVLDSTRVVIDPTEMTQHMIRAVIEFQRANNLFVAYEHLPLETLAALGVLKVGADDTSVGLSPKPAAALTSAFALGDMPPNPEPGHCYAKCAIPGAAGRPASPEWREIVCASNVTPELVMDLRAALINEGFLSGATDPGERPLINAETKAALRKYQEARELPIGNLDFATLEALGVQL